MSVCMFGQQPQQQQLQQQHLEVAAAAAAAVAELVARGVLNHLSPLRPVQGVPLRRLKGRGCPRNFVLNFNVYVFGKKFTYQCVFVNETCKVHVLISQ